MFIFKQPGSRIWHVLARFDCILIEHPHGKPSLCLTERLYSGSQVDSLSVHHEGVRMCGSCINALVDAFESYGHHREHMIPCKEDTKVLQHAEPTI